jgi:hypothetical protein
MSYLQPWMLWALPTVLLPIIIHLLNRLRYRTVHWGAMMFLLRANKAATRRAKIRQYLLLLFRALVILFLIWAMSRPITGGWIGKAAGGASEVVLVVLDRSASMEGRAPDSQETKRQHGDARLDSDGVGDGHRGGHSRDAAHSSRLSCEEQARQRGGMDRE